MSAARSASGEAALIPRDVKRLAVVLPSWVGDVVMATPVLRALREALPEAHIIGVLRPGLNELLAGSPWIDEYIVSRNTGWHGPWQLGREMRRRSPDAALLLPNSFRSALALRFSGCPIRIGYRRDGRGWLLTNAIAPPSREKPTPAVEYYAKLAEAALDTGDLDRSLQLHCTDAEREAADELLHDVTQPYIVLNPGANKLPKRWPPEQFAAAADELVRSHDVHVVVSGSPAEDDVVQRVVQAATSHRPFIDLVTRGVRLGSLKAVIQRASLIITNDTGPRHIAAAMRTPIVSLFGPTDHRWTLLPGVRERQLLAEPFLPEELTADEHAQACSIDRIRTSDVVAAARDLMPARPTP